MKTLLILLIAISITGCTSENPEITAETFNEPATPYIYPADETPEIFSEEIEEEAEYELEEDIPKEEIIELAEERSQVSGRELIEIPGACDNLIVTEPNEQVTYEDENLKFEISYNTEWGTKNYQLTPYDIENEQIIFGPLIKSINVGCVRPYRAFKMPARSAEEVLADFESREDPVAFFLEPQILSLNGNKAVEFEQQGMCADGGIEVIGKNNNMFFALPCNMTIGYPSTREIAETLEFSGD